MKIFINIITITLAALLVGCGTTEPVGPATPDATSEQICFGVPLPKTTKTPITDLAQIQDSSTTSVFVYGKRGGNQINGTNYEGGQIYYAPTGIWALASGTTTWVSGASYEFWGWAYSPTTAASSGSLTVTNNGREISVVQPATYSATGSIDYLLAHKFNATASTVAPIRGPIVLLELEHALAMVEIYVVKNPAMDNVTVNSITLENFHRNGTLVCTQSTYGDGTTNIWSTSTNDEQTSAYSLSGTMVLTADRTTTPAVMKFIAIPQQFGSSTTLTVNYSIIEQSGGVAKSFSQSFQLYNYNSWESAKRNIYTLTVDTSIHLYASIETWPTVNYVNGTILPEIK